MIFDSKPKFRIIGVLTYIEKIENEKKKNKTKQINKPNNDIKRRAASDEKTYFDELHLRFDANIQ